MARLIVKSPYIQCGKQNAGSYLRYIATRERVEIIPDDRPPTRKQEQLITKLAKDFPDVKELLEYEDYVQKPTKANASSLITLALEEHWKQVQQTDGYLKYIATRPRAERLGDHGLFGDADHVDLDAAMSELGHYTGNVWTHILSLHREDAERLGYNNAQAWRALLRAHRNDIAAAMHIPPQDFRWYAAFHNEGHHPHIHMMAWSVKPGQAHLDRDGIRSIRSQLTNDIFQQELLHVYEQKSVSRDELVKESRKVMLELSRQMRDTICEHTQAEHMVIRISEGEASFNSEIQNEPIDPESCTFQEEWFDFWDDEGKQLPDFSDPRFVFIGANDPSLGKNKKSDTSSIFALAKDTSTGYIYVLIADIAKRKPDQIIEDAIEASRRLKRDYKRPYYQFGVETVQFQYYFAEIMRQKSAAIGEYLPIVEINSVQNKDARIQSLQPFVSPSFEDDVMTGYTVNQELLDAWNTAHPDPDVLLEAREQKLTELSAACNAAIVAGCDVELADGVTGHISLTSEDQINLTNAAASVSAGAEEYPYHLDGKLCAMYSAADILTMAQTATAHKLYHTTYFNHLKAWVERSSAEEAAAIVYGSELPEDLAANMTALLAAAEASHV